MHYLVHSLLWKWIAVFIVIEGAISLNDIGWHIAYLLNMTTQTDASEIRNIWNPTRFGNTRLVMLALHLRWKRQCGSKMRNNSVQRLSADSAVNALSRGRSGGISQRRHTTSLHHRDRNVNRLGVWYNMNATNDSCEVHKIVHWKKVRYYRWSKYILMYYGYP